MTDRIARRFALSRAQSRAALIAFLMGGDPDRKTSLELMIALPAAGADLIEIGMPFTDPMADGRSIQAAGLRALQAGATLASVLSLVEQFRRHDDETPVILMGYYNPVYVYGVDRFAVDAKAAGVDGLIIVDLPPEEDEELRGPAARSGLALVRLATPTTDAKRLATVLAHASGFIYYVSITGVTGAAIADYSKVGAAVSRVKAQTDLPVAVGFGVKNGADAAAVAEHADAVVVGTALIDALKATLDSDGRAGERTVAAVADLIRDLARGVRGRRRDERQAQHARNKEDLA